MVFQDSPELFWLVRLDDLDICKACAPAVVPILSPPRDDVVVVWHADGTVASPVAVASVVLVATPVEDEAMAVAHVIAATLAVVVAAVDGFGKLSVE